MHRSRFTAATVFLVIALAASGAGVSLGQEDSTESPPGTTDWTRLADGPWATGGLGIPDAASAPDGQVVIADTYLHTAWTSDDLASWQETKLGKPVAGAYLLVTGTPWGIEALTVNSSKPSLDLRSTADGIAWERPTRIKSGLFSGWEVAGDSLFVFGTEGQLTGRRPMLWRTSDGESYAALDLADVREGAGLSGVARLPDGRLLIATRDSSGGKPQLHRGTWGGTWEPITGPWDKPPKAGDIWLATMPDGVVLATEEGRVTTLWFSDNAVEWQPAAQSRGGDGLRRAGDRLVLMPAMLSTTDGLNWCSIDRPGGKRDIFFGVAAAPDGGLLLTGVARKTNKKGREVSATTVWVTQDPVCKPRKAPATPEVSSEPVPSTSSSLGT